MTVSTASTPFLPSERRKTDASLLVERDKTNESLLSAREQTEQQIDASVVDERAKADRLTTSARKAADTHRDSDRSSEQYDVRDERRHSDARLQDERRHADIAIDLERKRVDIAIDSERELKSALASRLLNIERRMTDQNLKNERFQADSEVQQSSGQLAHEVSEHLKTRISLTSREEFLAIVSHDLRNPIGSASSCAGMLLEDTAYGNMEPELRHWITFIKRNVDTSLRLIADLLDVERGSQGKALVKSTRCCIGDIVRETIATLNQSASAKSIRLQVVPPDLQCETYCDSDRIRQVLSNLIGNALKFTPEFGSVTVTVEPDADEVRISVSDTGPGIPKDRITQIFERFAQIGLKDRSGLGLGLYISRMLVEAHGGRIWVESDVNHGSTFKFTLPRQSA